MTRLLIDGTPIVVNPTGVGRYAEQTCLRLPKHLPADWRVQVLVHPDAVTALPPDLQETVVAVAKTSEIAHALTVLPTSIKSVRPDIVLKLNEIAGIVRGVPTVTICHDIDVMIQRAQNLRRSPKRIMIDEVKRRLRRRALWLSSRVVCNSVFVQRAVQVHYGICEPRTAVAYCGIDPRFYEIASATKREDVLRRYNLHRFVLTFATGDPRENYAILPGIAAELARHQVHTCLLVAGMRPSQPYAASLQREFSDRGLVEGTHYLFEDFLGTDRFTDLAGLYTAADFYLELSLHEGFGMQLAEAMACGTTCLSSARGGLAEVGGVHTVALDRLDGPAVAAVIAAAYAQGLHERDNRSQVEHTRTFSWDHTAAVIAENLVVAFEGGLRD